MNEINIVRKIAEFNTEVALYKKRKDFIIDEVKLKNIMLKYEQNKYLLIKHFPKVNIDRVLLNPKLKDIDTKKLDLSYLNKNIYINT